MGDFLAGLDEESIGFDEVVGSVLVRGDVVEPVAPVFGGFSSVVVEVFPGDTVNLFLQ